MSGGEPLLQIDFLIDPLKRKAMGINKTLDSCGNPLLFAKLFFKFEELMHNTDLIFV